MMSFGHVLRGASGVVARRLHQQRSLHVLRPVMRPLCLRPKQPLNALVSNASRRAWYTNMQSPAAAPPNKAAVLLGAGGLMVGTYMLLDQVLNSHSDIALRLGSTLPLDSRDYLHSTFRYVVGGLGMTAASATVAFRQGFAHRMLAMSPMMYLGVSLASTIGLSMATMATSHRESPLLKHVLWASTMCAFGAVSLSSMAFLPTALLGRAALYTGGVVGSLGAVAMRADEGAFLYLGGPLMAGLTVVALSSVASVFAPATGTVFRIAHSLSLYGGLVVFGGFVLYDTQAVMERGARNLDPNPDFINESFALYMDTINIFVRMVQILAMQQSSRRK